MKGVGKPASGVPVSLFCGCGLPACSSTRQKAASGVVVPRPWQAGFDTESDGDFVRISQTAWSRFTIWGTMEMSVPHPLRVLL